MKNIEKTSELNPLTPYNYYVLTGMKDFWADYGTRGRKILFIFGHGFDPRCVSALSVAAEIFGDAGVLHTCCARFTNIFDGNLEVNYRCAMECLSRIRYTTSSLRSEGHFRHCEIEVNMFSGDKNLIGDRLLINEFIDSFPVLDDYTDIIVDISAFPRTLMYALLCHLWKARRPRQNLFAVLTEVKEQPAIDESDYTAPTFMLGGSKPPDGSSVIWIPVLGGRIERFEAIYGFLSPKAIFPIIPFPAKNPRLGDEIILSGRKYLCEEWSVPFENVMYASGEIPFDVFRKIQDFVAEYEALKPLTSIVVSALSGRSLSLGVLLAALHSDLSVCHAQPTTYMITEAAWDRLKRSSEGAIQTLYWLAGEVYD